MQEWLHTTAKRSQLIEQIYELAPFAFWGHRLVAEHTAFFLLALWRAGPIPAVLIASYG